VVLNNKGWRAPKGSTLALYPEGWARKTTADGNHCSIDPPPDYVGIAVTAGDAVGWKVERVEGLVPAFDSFGGRQGGETGLRLVTQILEVS
jgi:acetolactate synthase I/II/III large subunit